MNHKENQDEPYTMIDLYLYDRFFGYKDYYNYYDIDVDKILLFTKSNNEYIITVNKMKIVPLQLKIKNFYGKILTYAYNNRMMPIHSDDKELFRKCREIRNKITELMGINNADYFVETTEDDDDDDEYIMVGIHKNTSFL